MEQVSRPSLTPKSKSTLAKAALIAGLCTGVSTSCSETISSLDADNSSTVSYANLDLPLSHSHTNHISGEQIHFPVQTLLDRDDLQRYLEDATREAFQFRDTLFERDENLNPRLDEYNRMIKEFTSNQDVPMDPSANYRYSSDALQHLISADVADTAIDRFNRFNGEWVGNWDGMNVYHYWGEVVLPDPPIAFDLGLGRTAEILAYQYCWVGDGYALNLVVDEYNRGVRTTWILGHVVHLNNPNNDYLTGSEIDLTDINYKVPHVGFITNNGLAWLTDTSVFIESTSTDGEGYDIRGFSFGEDYSLKEGYSVQYRRPKPITPSASEGFQKVTYVDSTDFAQDLQSIPCRNIRYGVGCQVISSLGENPRYTVIDDTQWRPGITAGVYGDGYNFLSTCFETENLRDAYSQNKTDDQLGCDRDLYRVVPYFNAQMNYQDVTAPNGQEIFCVTEVVR